MPHMSFTPVSKLPDVARELRIRGRVQGVYYRASMVEQARRLGAVGWVRNRADGSVQAWVQGAPEVVDALVDWARRGPPQAQVSEVVLSEEVPQALQGFEARATV